jgi:hypothetical protein
MRRLNLAIVIAALAVTSPRLVLAFLLGDGIDIPQHVEVALLSATGVAAGVVLTTGNAVLAHALATKARQINVLWWVLLLCWICFLVSAVVIVSPTLVAGLERSSLLTVLETPRIRWYWAVCAVVSVEVLVAGSTAAAILEQDVPVGSAAERGLWHRVGNALVGRLEQSLTASVLPSQSVNTLSLHGEDSEAALPITSTQKKRQRQQAIIQRLMEGEGLDITELAERFTVTPKTIYLDLKEIQAQVNGSATE